MLRRRPGHGCADAVCRAPAKTRSQPTNRSIALLSPSWLEVLSERAERSAERERRSCSDGAVSARVGAGDAARASVWTMTSPTSVELESADNPRDSVAPVLHQTPGLLAGVDRSDGSATSTSMTSRAWRAVCAAALSRKCSVALAVIAAFVLMPHQQPFHATPLLYGTLWLWWAAPVLLPAALLCVAVQLCRCNRPGRLRRLSAGAPALVFSYIWYFGLAEHGFLDRIWWEETGFLKLCYDWCGGGPWAVRSACYRDGGAAHASSNTSAAEAVAFFRAHIFGRAAGSNTHTKAQPRPAPKPPWHAVSLSSRRECVPLPTHRPGGGGRGALDRGRPHRRARARGTRGDRAARSAHADAQFRPAPFSGIGVEQPHAPNALARSSPHATMLAAAEATRLLRAALLGPEREAAAAAWMPENGC